MGGSGKPGRPQTFKMFRVPQAYLKPLHTDPRLTETCGELEACSLRLGQRLADGADEVSSVNLETFHKAFPNGSVLVTGFHSVFKTWRISGSRGCMVGQQHYVTHEFAR